MKIAVVYTGITPELKDMVDKALKAELAGHEIEILTYKDPSIIKEANEQGKITHGCARRLLDMYEKGSGEGAQIIFNICSSVGDVAKLAKPLYAMTGVALVRIDEDMAMDAVSKYSRIGVVATLKSTLEPTKRLIRDCAEKQGREVTVVDALAQGAFGIDQETFTKMLIETGSKVKDQVDALMFAQGSMAYAEKAVSQALGLPVFSSVYYGAKAVGKAACEI